MSIIDLNRIKNLKINNKKIIKSSRVKDKSLIQCIDEDISADFEEMMKRGYIEMAEINLGYSMIGSEYMLDDVNEYEAWICGV
ncbi:hypothetical protein EHW71_10890 [Clostridium butyricum]|uniref:hypothetical protein n=1 Tax=Clostridium butyricum TaxID=1492 RepID=UPI000F52FCA0|nr:hypothetical protein [Clostridium butyricum]RQN10344.1 hypothetical protein EHW71_10890 [Clostridium butyricum]